MPPVLVLGCVAALTLTGASPPPTAGADRTRQADRVSPPSSAGEKWRGQVRESAGSSNRNHEVICALRIMRADPSIDRTMAVAIERPVDPGMAVPSRCAAE
jgi:hypothetical protein